MSELPPLTGTPTQVKWAEAARARFAAEMIVRERETAAYLATEDGQTEWAKFSAAKESREHDWIRSQTDATWWIERRSMKLQWLIRQAELTLTPPPPPATRHARPPRDSLH